MKSKRVHIDAVKPYANANIYKQYTIQDARWVSHPKVDPTKDQFLYFRLDFELEDDTTFILHVSGDQRFELKCDGLYLGMGPDRSDLTHWSFHSYELNLKKGQHLLEVDLHFITTATALAQLTHYPALIVGTEGEACPELRTGHAPWHVQKREGIHCYKSKSFKGFMVAGPEFHIESKSVHAQGESVFAKPYGEEQDHDPYGQIYPHWRLFPTRLAEQVRASVSGMGKIRSVTNTADAPMIESKDGMVEHWNSLVAGAQITIPSHTTQSVLWDLEEYFCAYPELWLRGGKDSSVVMRWAESCFMDNDHGQGHKGNRNDIEGKYFFGFGDTFTTDGGDVNFTTPWWRAGRYIQITVSTSDAPLTIARISLSETRYPSEDMSSFSSNDTELDAIEPLAVRGIEMCRHETYMDCPYYEQMMYVGDTRLQMLTHYTMEHQPPLNLRSIELFDWSRHVSNFVLERHPSSHRQLSTTFSMIWILILKDQAWWQDNPDFVKERMPGMRSMLEEFRSLADDRMILSHLPGWSFIDWVDSWNIGYAPEGQFGTSAVNNLLFLLTLQSAIELEGVFGDEFIAQSYGRWSTALTDSIRDLFWDAERGIFADDLNKEDYSEHAQCLAILSGCFPELEDQCFRGLITAPDLARTTVYFSFYLLETFKKMGRGDLIIEKMDFWKDLVSQGFKTPVETPEPSRSDCHAWGSHPLFHMHASIMGIRPTTPGFKQVEIAPQLGGLTEFRTKTPHPLGWIEVDIQKQGLTWTVEVSLPVGLEGSFIWDAHSYPLQAGAQNISL